MAGIPPVARPARAFRLGAGSLVIAVLLGIAAAASAQPSERGVEKAGALPPPLPLFPADNWWNTDVSGAPLDPRSDALIDFVGRAKRLHPDWGHESGATLPDAVTYGMPYVVVSGHEPLEPVTFEYDDESDAGAPGRPPGYPIPVEARTESRWIEGGVPGGGTSGDRHLLLVDRDNRLLYELYALQWSPTRQRWSAGSGAVFTLDGNLRRPEGWTSADAAGLAILPGLVRHDEAYGTQPIRHAFRVTVRATNGYVYPASHRAGSNSSALPMGARLRLKASKDVSGYAPHLRRIFQAMKTHGLIVADNGSDMFVTGTYDPRWDMDPIVTAFRTLNAGDFEVVQLGWRPPAAPPPPDTDQDGDGLPDEWERLSGLDPTDGNGDNGQDGDPDDDGATNLAEWTAGTHPRGTWRRWFAEGVTSPFFSTRLALLNASDEPATALLRFERTDGAVVSVWRTLAARERQTVDAADHPGLEAAEFGIHVEADQAVVVDRTVSWDATGYGAHAETGLPAPAREWHFAEGATHSGFDLFYLLLNPADGAAEARIDFLRPGGLPVIARVVTVPPHARATVWVNTVDPALSATDVSAVITTDAPLGLVAERAMYRSRGAQVFAAGHAAAGVTNPASRWLLAEGATGPFFDLFVLLSNPGDLPAEARLTFLLPDGRTVVSGRNLPPRSRETVWVDHEAPELADTAVSVVVEAGAHTPVIVERSMWWPGDVTQWHEAHASAGVPSDGLLWAIADGESDPARGLSTYVLVANVGATAGVARVSVYFEGGGTAGVVRVLPPNSRTNIDVGAEVEGAEGKRFAVLVESLGETPAPLVVERATYWDTGDVAWAAGTSAAATRLR